MRITLLLFAVLLSVGCALPLEPSAPVDPVGVFVWDGNSLTQSRNGAVPMPENVMHALGDPPHLRYVNAGESGHTTPEMLLSAPRLVYPLYRPGQVNLLGVWEGINDLYFGATAEQAFEHLRDYALDGRAAGFAIVLLTLTPRGDHPPATYEADRAIVNARLRTEWRGFASALVDVAADPIMGDPATDFGGIYISPIDHVHLTDAGSQRVAGLVAAAVKALL